MDRREFLAAAAGGGLVSTAGCSGVSEDPGPFDFGITNWRRREYTAEVLLRKNEDVELIDGRFDIAANEPDREDPPGIYLRDVTRVRNGDVIDARVALDGEPYRGRYEVTCNRTADFENDFFLRIRSGDAGRIEFSGSECGV
ncbi:hypothetical protein Hbl1158_05020 [Halobaculum sp. CBA1158]|uniref:hypothetical protein n=1 Tax=Halobaculum sp. CBA1158 TaxID=2904243 RepID=UPI001F3D21B9|nr:hypothetical protein [Halobaculum sp. CBA1158]UIP00721.1 hypothetical protein Hbl1158_05020 [Halobaculum sp. CBA1158]